MTHVVRRYGPFRLQHGCDPGDTGCMGPLGEYWTFMNVELHFLWFHAAFAALFAGIVLGVLLWLLRGAPRRWAWTAGATVVGFVTSFLVVVWWVGNPVVY